MNIKQMIADFKAQKDSVAANVLSIVRDTEAFHLKYRWSIYIRAINAGVIAYDKDTAHLPGIKSMYDDLYMERYETRCVTTIIEAIEESENYELANNLREYFIQHGITLVTFDW